MLIFIYIHMWYPPPPSYPRFFAGDTSIEVQSGALNFNTPHPGFKIPMKLFPGTLNLESRSIEVQSGALNFDSGFKLLGFKTHGVRTMWLGGYWFAAPPVYP